MGHMPHLYLPGPWNSSELRTTVGQRNHLVKSLRIRDAAGVSYTDGLGRVGHGSFEEGSVTRGVESQVERTVKLVLAMAPPPSRERQRFAIEKLAELGVERVIWLKTEFGATRPPSDAKSKAWAISALEQSRGAWLMETDSALMGWDGLEWPLAVCDQGGTQTRPLARTVVVGPEGGWAPGEIPEEATTWDLGPSVLRVETAAVVAAARLV